MENQTSEKLIHLQKKMSKKKLNIFLISTNKASIRSIESSFDLCNVANNFKVRDCVTGLKEKHFAKSDAQLVLLDADCFPDQWDKMVLLANDLPAVQNGGVVVLSSFGDKDVLVRARLAGARDFIVKPFDVFSIYNMIGRLDGFYIEITKVIEG